MPVTYDFAVADARNDAYETAIGTAPIVRVYSGTMPTNVRTALSGNTLLAQGTLPSDWMAASASGVKAKAGAWTLTGQAGAGAGTVGTFYRIFESTGTTAREQGTFGALASGDDMTTDSASDEIANAQTLTVTTFSKTDGNL